MTTPSLGVRDSYFFLSREIVLLALNAERRSPAAVPRGGVGGAKNLQNQA
jgi:hypothetical protein